ncbi:MAG: type II toxin-antitoxin system Phd/YefM family antitoxin [Peptococcaceae bacterium]|nr:MAG: type II toxin-antitoxin system Phd/YefM family antitoxin [Peptococcaceae bacterium]
MEFVTVREFKTHASELMHRKEPVVVFRNSKPAGVFIPWDDINIGDELRRAALKALTAKLAKERSEKGVTEGEVLEDFASFRKSRRGCQCDTVRADRRESR